MRRCVVVLAVCVACLCVAAGIGYWIVWLVSPQTIAVRPGGSIQAAIDKAREDAVIRIGAGTWYENIVVYKSITLVGEGPEQTVLRGAFTGTVFRGQFKGEVISIFPHAWKNLRDARAVQAVVEGVNIVQERSDSPGVSLWTTTMYGSVQASIRNCTIVGDYGVDSDPKAILSGIGSSGIELAGVAEATIAGCSISENAYCIKLSNYTQATITDCHMSGVYGVLLGDEARSSLANCTIADNVIGVALAGRSQVTLTDCFFLSNTYGVSFAGLSKGTITNCDIFLSTYGILVGDSAQATISGCSTMGTSCGIVLDGTSQTTITACLVATSKRFGVTLFEQPCCLNEQSSSKVLASYPFSGYVTGSGNKVPGPDENNPNQEGAVCPTELKFLMTAEGGELDRRE